MIKIRECLTLMAGQSQDCTSPVSWVRCGATDIKEVVIWLSAWFLVGLRGRMLLRRSPGHEVADDEQSDC